MKKTMIVILASILAMSSQLVLAKKAPAFYAGIGGGVTSLDTQQGAQEFNDDDAGFKVYGGMMLDKHWGLELSYHSLGEYSHNGVFQGNSFESEVDELFAVTIALVPVIPIYKKMISLVPRLGFSYWEADLTVKTLGVKTVDSTEEYDLMYGLGPRFTINKNVAIEAGWERFLLDGDDLDFYSIGVRISTR